MQQGPVGFNMAHKEQITLTVLIMDRIEIICINFLLNLSPIFVMNPPSSKGYKKLYYSSYFS